MEKKALYNYCLRLGDTSLIAGQRLAEWCSNGPTLEEDIALSNISLDYFGQCRTLLTYAGSLLDKPKTEDELAFHRNEREFFNVLITELPNKDFGYTVVKQLFLSNYLQELYTQLTNSSDTSIAAFATKSLKEIHYHVRHFNDWFERLAQGTEESNSILNKAIKSIWKYVPDLFLMDAVDEKLIKTGVAANLSIVKENWEERIQELFATNSIEYSGVPSILPIFNRLEGVHTEYLGHLLCEMQYLPRMHPNASW